MTRLRLLVALVVTAGRAQPDVEQARFHNGHLNPTDRARSTAFYQRLGGCR